MSVQADPVAAIAWIAFTFALAGIVKGIVGMGLPALAMGMLGLVMPPLQAAMLLVVPSLVTNVWQLAAGPAFGRLARQLATMMIGIAVGTMLGIGVLTGGQTRWPAAALGAVLALYAAIGLVSPRFAVPERAQHWLSPMIGVATGLVTGATGVFVLPAVPYLASLGFDREELIQALGLSFTVSTLALGAALATRGAFGGTAAWSSILAVLPALAGMFVGTLLRYRLPHETFRRWFLVALMILGAYMFVRSALA